MGGMFYPISLNLVNLANLQFYLEKLIGGIEKMKYKRNGNGQGLYVSTEEGETREEMIVEIILAAIKNSFAARKLEMPEDITKKTVAKYISTSYCREGNPAVKPFYIRGVVCPLFIKYTDSQTKILIAPVHGLCPGVLQGIMENITCEPTILGTNDLACDSSVIPIGLHSEFSR